jgi:hypothetical protein
VIGSTSAQRFIKYFHDLHVEKLLTASGARTRGFGVFILITFLAPLTHLFLCHLITDRLTRSFMMRALILVVAVVAATCRCLATAVAAAAAAAAAASPPGPPPPKWPPRFTFQGSFRLGNAPQASSMQYFYDYSASPPSAVQVMTNSGGEQYSFLTIGPKTFRIDVHANTGGAGNGATTGCCL